MNYTLFQTKKESQIGQVWIIATHNDMYEGNDLASDIKNAIKKQFGKEAEIIAVTFNDVVVFAVDFYHINKIGA